VVGTKVMVMISISKTTFQPLKNPLCNFRKKAVEHFDLYQLIRSIFHLA